MKVKIMNLKEVIEVNLIEIPEYLSPGEAAQIICDAIEPQLRIIVEMRYAQRAYFRRRIEDNLSRAKKLENIVDEMLLPIDTKRQIVIQPDLLIF